MEKVTNVFWPWAWPWLNAWQVWNEHTRATAEYCRVTNNLPVPEWASPFEVYGEDERTRFLHFPGNEGKDIMVFMPPRAGHWPMCVDWPGKSMIDAALKNGFDVYAFDWKEADLNHRDDDIGAFIQTMHNFIVQLGQPVTLVGVCQGGWQSAIFASLYPELVVQLLSVAAPIDFHASKSKITDWAKNANMAALRAGVAMNGGLLDGRCMLLGFKCLNPIERFVGDWWKLYQNILEDKDDDIRHQSVFMGWYERTHNLPGKFWLQVVDMFKYNRLVRNEMIILGRVVRLSEYNGQLIIVVGEKDDITPEEQAIAFKDHVLSKKVMIYRIPEVGHFGAFASTKSYRIYLNEVFPAMKKTLIRLRTDQKMAVAA